MAKNTPQVNCFPEWVSVSDRLPDEAGPFLLTCNEGAVSVVTTGQYEGEGQWTPDYNHMLPSGVVTHWMPLPKEPPQAKVVDRLVLREDPEEDGLVLVGDVTGERGNGEPCVTASTDSMANRAKWVYLPLSAAVKEIIAEKDCVPVDDMAQRIREAVEAGIASGAAIRKAAGT